MSRDPLRCEPFSRHVPRVTAAVFAGVLCLAGSLFEGRTANAAETVRLLTYVGSLGDWSPYVAIELGYFKDEGIDLKMSAFQNAGDVTTAIVSGQGDIATGSLPVAIAGAVVKTPVKLISATQKATPKGGYNNWWAALPNSPLNAPADLRGKKVHIFAQNTLAQTVTREILGSAGLKVGDYQEVALPFPQAYTGLEGGLMDVSLFIEPFFTRSNALSKQKYGKPLKVIYTYLTAFPDGLELSGMFANTNFLANKPEAARAFLRATTRAAKWGNANPDELKKIIAKHAGVPYDDIKDIITSEMSEDGRFIPGFLDRLQSLMIQYKMVPNFTSPLPESAFVDLSYLPPAR